jgi:hypothetical protein
MNSVNIQKYLTGCIFLLAMITCGCAGGSDIQEQISGKWKRSEGDGTVEIQLVTAPKSLIIDGQKYSAVVEKIDKGRFSVKVKVQNSEGKTEMWNLWQIWDDNGTKFKLAFDHGGSKEILIRSGHS